METKQINHYAIPAGVEHHFDLTFAIEDPDQFEDFFAVLRQAGPEDLIYIHINSPGGQLDTTVQIINAMDECAATIITSAEGQVASGAAIVFFSGHAFKIADHCEFLIHTASGGNLGKISDNLSAVRFQVDRMNKIYSDVLGGFLTEQELDWIARGEEFYLSSDEVKERIQAYVERMQEEAEEEEETESE